MPVEATWQVIVSPVTFEPVYTLKIRRGAVIRNVQNLQVSREHIQDGKVAENEVLLLLLDALREDEVGIAYNTFRTFVAKMPTLPTN